MSRLDGIETGVRQLIREEPLETTVITHASGSITLPTQAEILRIKGVLILKRNATRDYLDFIALADKMGDALVVEALKPFDTLYTTGNQQSPLQQLHIQLSNAMPFDLEETELAEYKNLHERWHNWRIVQKVCAHVATVVFDGLCS